MEDSGYERFGLIGNPFQNLDSESLSAIEIFHVNQAFDGALQQLKQEVLDGKEKAVVALVGALGTGKTERLLVARSQAERIDAYAVFHQLTTESRWVVRDLARNLRETARLSAFARSVSPPKWYVRVGRLAKRAEKRYDPEEAGRLFAEVLSAQAPSFLLLNDLHAIAEAEDADGFLQVLLSLVTHAKPGVLIMVGSYPEFWQRMAAGHGALVSRFHKVHEIQAMSVEDASLLIAKRLAGKRIVDDLDPLYPFTPYIVATLLEAARWNPRRLLALAQRALQVAVRNRAYRVDDGAVAEAVRSLAPRADVADPETVADEDGPEGNLERLVEPDVIGRTLAWSAAV
jgi:type II secretory pathway predicted ATPase ExeA